MERRLAAILFADVVGYSRLMSQDEIGTLGALKAIQAEVLSPKVADYHGRIVKYLGDGALVEFASVVNAVGCAMAVQQAIAERNEGEPKNQSLALRIGVNLGDVIADEDDIHGDGVNIAARLEGLAKPGGICISGKVHEEVAARLGLACDDLGEQEFKNIDRPVRVYRVRQAEADPVGQSHPLSLPDKPSIVVLPFDNMSERPDQDYFADGITDDIIARLARISQLFVIARNTAFTYKGRAVDMRTVAGELGVRYVLEGSVRRAGTRIRIGAQLIDGTTGHHLWAERYERALDDIFALQDDLTDSIVAAIEPELSSAEQERARRKPPHNLDAWDYYHRGLWHMNRGDKEENTEALKQFDCALALDPEFASVHAEAANVRFNDIIDGYTEITPDIVQAGREAAARAVALDDRNSVAHLAMGKALLLECRHDAAIAELEMAVSLNPSSARALYGLGFALIFAGRTDDAVQALQTAIRLSPHDPDMASFLEMLAWAHLQARNYEAAADYATRAARKPGNEWWIDATEAAALGHLGRLDGAHAALALARSKNPDISPAYIRKRVYYDLFPENLEHYIDGLRKAGLGD